MSNRARRVAEADLVLFRLPLRYDFGAMLKQKIKTQCRNSRDPELHVAPCPTTLTLEDLC